MSAQIFFFKFHLFVANYKRKIFSVMRVVLKSPEPPLGYASGNLGECFISLHVELVAGKNASLSDKNCGDF